jgi:excisionase family DNA binding protein
MIRSVEMTTEYQKNLTIAEAADILRLSESTLRYWIQTGKYDLRPVRMGGRLFIPPEIVQEVCENGTKNLKGSGT